MYPFDLGWTLYDRKVTEHRVAMMVRETHLFPVPRPGLVSNQQLNSHNALTKPSAQQGASLVEVRRAAQLNVLPLAIIALYTAGGDSHSGHKAVCVPTCSFARYLTPGILKISLPTLYLRSTPIRSATVEPKFPLALLLLYFPFD